MFLPHRRWFRALAAMALLAISLPALAALQPFTADYRANYMGVQADGQMQLLRDGQNWRYQLHIKTPIAELRQSTLFDVADGVLRPLTSQDNASLPFKSRKVDARYDWKTRQATWSGDIKPDRRGPIALQKGDMDALLINLAIARDFAAKKPLDYRMVDEGRIKDLHYTVEGQETMTLDGKQVPVTRVSRTDGDKQQIAWISAAYPMPLRLLQRKGGRDELDLTIRSIR